MEKHHKIFLGAFFSISVLSVSPASISLLVPAGFGGHSFIPGPQFSNPRAHISGFVGFSETLPHPSLSLTCGCSPWAFWHLPSLPQADSFVRCGRRHSFTSYRNLLMAPRRTHYQPQHLQKGAAPLYVCLRCSLPLFSLAQDRLSVCFGIVCLFILQQVKIFMEPQ